MAYALAGGLGSSMMFSYISVSAFVSIDVYHFTPVQFSWLFGCNAAALIVAAQLNARVLRTVSAPVVLRRALTTSAVDRKSVVVGKGVSVRVDIGGGRLIQKKRKNNTDI